MTIIPEWQGNAIAEYLADRIALSFESAIKRGRTPRLICPLCTGELALAAHMNLRALGVNSVLVAGSGRYPDPNTRNETCITDVDKMVSFRLEPVVYVLEPGLLPLVPQSLRGTGGTSLKLEIPERWPLESGEVSIFDLIEHLATTVWKLPDEVVRSIQNVVKTLLVPSLASRPDGARLLVEEFLSDNPWTTKIGQSAQAFCGQVGILWHESISESVNRASYKISTIQAIAATLRETSQSGEELERRLKAIFSEDPPTETVEKAQDLRVLMDGLFRNDHMLSGFLSLSSGLKRVFAIRGRRALWITFETLVDLLEISTTVGTATIEFSHVISNAVLLGDVATQPIILSTLDHTDLVTFRVAFEVDTENVAIRLKIGRRIAGEQHVSVSQISANFDVPIDELANSGGGERKKVVAEILDGNVVLARATASIVLLDSSGALLHFKGADKSSDLIFAGSPAVVHVDCPTRVRMVVGESLGSDFDWRLDGDALVARRAQDSERIIELVQTLDPKLLQAAESLLEVESIGEDLDDGALSFEVSLITGESSAGHFTVDALLESEVTRFRRKRSPSLEEALDLFLGNTSDVGRKLGIPKFCVSRTSFARYFEASSERDEFPFAPLITDLFSTEELRATSFRVSDESELVKVAKVLDRNPFSIHKSASEQFLALLAEYRSTRNAVIDLAVQNCDAEAVGHPVYCYAPLYCKRTSEQMEGVLSKHVEAYSHLVRSAVGDQNSCFLDRFLALNIDCVLSVSSETEYQPYSDIKLLGPWHPLVAAQRYFYQKALTEYAGRISESDVSDLDIFAKLTPLLRDSQLAYVLASLGVEAEQLARLANQLDSGWILALPNTVSEHIAKLKSDNPVRLAEDAARFKNCSGFDLLADLDDIAESVGDMIGKYVSSVPASNRVGVRFGSGFDLENIVAELQSELHDNNGEPTELMELLPGGIDLYIDGLQSEDAVDAAIEISEENLPVRLYSILRSSNEQIHSVDVSFLSPRDTAEFTKYHQEFRKYILRGTGDSFLLSRQPRQTRPRAAKLESVGPIYENPEFDGGANEYGDLERNTRTMCSLLQSAELVGSEEMDVSAGSVPTAPTGKWEYLPGEQTDPAILSQYLQANRDRSLWDFQFGIGRKGKESHYVLSKHTNVLLAALRTAIGGSNESVTDILLDMSRIGSPLLRESNGTMNKAKGCAGLVATRRIIPLQEILEAGSFPILVPIDSFDGIIGYKASSRSETDSRMADLLLLVFTEVQGPTPAVEIRATAVEAKYRSVVPSSLSSFFIQTGQTYERIERLFMAGNEAAFLPCRIAIAEIVGFGLRLAEIGGDVSDKILQSIVCGSYEWRSSNLSSLVTILTPQQGQETQLRKQFDGGWKAIVSTSDFPSATTTEESPIKPMREKILSLVCDFQQKSRAVSADPNPPPIVTPSPTVPAKSNSVEDIGKQDSQRQPRAQEPEHGPGDGTAGVILDTGQSPEEFLRNGYAKVAKLLKEWKVSLEPVDSQSLMRNTPSCFRYQYKLRSSKDLSKASRADFLTAIKYELELEENANITVSISRGYLVFEIGKNKEDRYPVYADELWSKVETMYDGIDRLAVAVGESVATGDPVIVDFKKLPHLLIAGQTGAGKSVAIETIVEGLTRFYSPEMFELSIVDFKGVDFLRYRDSPHLRSEIAGDAQGALNLLGGLVSTTNDRMKLFAEKRVKNISEYNSKYPDSRLAYKMVVIDEFAELVLDETTKKGIIQLVQSIAQKSRAAGTHLIVCTQYPRGDVVDRLITANLPGRLCLKVPDSTASGVVLNESGAEKLALDGDALYVDGTSGTVRLQVAIVRD